MVVITIIADILVYIQPFISSNELGNSGVVHPKVTNSLSILLVFTQQILFQFKLLFKSYIKITRCHTSELTLPFLHELIFLSLCSTVSFNQLMLHFCVSQRYDKPPSSSIDLQDPWWRIYTWIMQIEWIVKHYSPEFCFFTFYQPPPEVEKRIISF